MLRTGNFLGRLWWRLSMRNRGLPLSQQTLSAALSQIKVISLDLGSDCACDNRTSLWIDYFLWSLNLRTLLDLVWQTCFFLTIKRILVLSLSRAYDEVLLHILFRLSFLLLLKRNDFCCLISSERSWTASNILTAYICSLIVDTTSSWASICFHIVVSSRGVVWVNSGRNHANFSVLLWLWVLAIVLWDYASIIRALLQSDQFFSRSTLFLFNGFPLLICVQKQGRASSYLGLFLVDPRFLSQLKYVVNLSLSIICAILKRVFVFLKNVRWSSHPSLVGTEVDYIRKTALTSLCWRFGVIWKSTLMASSACHILKSFEAGLARLVSG